MTELVSIVVPAYREEENVARLYERVSEVLGPTGSSSRSSSPSTPDRIARSTRSSPLESATRA